MKKEIQYFCRKVGITEDQFTGKKEVGGDLWLDGLTSIPEGFNPTVGGSLGLDGLTSIPEGFNPTVGGDLWLRGLTSIPEGFNPTVGGDLWLRGLTSIPEGFNPTVGGDLWLRGLTSIPEGFNPTVGGDLWLRGLTSEQRKKVQIKRPDPVLIESLRRNKLLFWKDGKYVKADGIFTEVISKHGNVYKVKKIHSVKEFYLVTNGKIHAHGETVEKAKEDFRFKVLSEKLKKDPIKEDTIITINHYRVVTGACELGVRNWMESVFTPEQRKEVSENGIKASELLPILKKHNAYGIDRFTQLITF